MTGSVRIQPFGEHAVIVQWEAIISEHIHAEVLQFQKWVELQFASEVLETVTSYHELAIYLKSGVNLSEFIQLLKTKKSTPYSEVSELKKRMLTIPVCYDASFAEDLSRVATINNLTEAEVINIHSEKLYTVYFIGFLPGFPYLGGMDSRLATPRLEIPRAKVAKGAVAIGGSQTGIYPQSSPGGWNVIGRTPIELFSMKNESSGILKAGDLVRFKAISIEKFQLIETEIANTTYQLKVNFHD
ncbi:5-oxoprolinase subunit PxpB [Jejudonia soesokkakensis]|uniref:5-oxoprolinase subunit PxpB n=1 Tax=Jejudonia soesokkakensis TaxID=1323432 RepID=A0ABW2MVP4_9FLAO